MRPIRPMKSGEKKKRMMEFKNNFNSGHKHLSSQQLASSASNRSTSAGRLKKIKLTSDHQDYQIKNMTNKQMLNKIVSPLSKKPSCQYMLKKRSSPDSGGYTPGKNSPKSPQIKQLLLKKHKQNSSQRVKSKEKGSSEKRSLSKYNGQKSKKKRHQIYLSEIQPLEAMQSKINKATSKAKRSKKDTSKNKSGEFKKQQNFDTYLIKNQLRQQIEQSTFKTIKKIKNKDNDIQQVSTYQEFEERSITVQNQEMLFEQGSKRWVGLSEEEEEVFGDRFPYGFKKVKLLGKGGFSLVWLGRHLKSNKQFAIKQIITENVHKTHLVEIWFGTTFFNLGGVPKPEFGPTSGVNNLARMYSYEINQNDTWIFYEKCGHSLGSALYDIKIEKNYIEDRAYRIYYKPLYRSFVQSPSILNKVIIQICKPLTLLTTLGIVHSDLKTENILIKCEPSGKIIQQAKLIDYGSCFKFEDISQFSMATPEYMPPEILNYIIHENEGDYEEELYQEVMRNYQNPWTIDIFSLGCVFLEIIVGVPLWMSLPLIVQCPQGRGVRKIEGLFAIKGRNFKSIISKQRKAINNLDSILQQCNYSGIKISPHMKKALKGMLTLDFNKRLSPSDVIKTLEQDINLST